MQPQKPQISLSTILFLFIGTINQQSAFASAGDESSAIISYTINSMLNTNTATPNDLSGLVVAGGFQQLTDNNDQYAQTSGDGGYISATPNLPSTVVTGNNFNDAMTVSASSANYGAANILQTGQFSLNFTDTGSSSYNIDVTLNYSLNAISQGLYASNTIILDYWDTLNNINGFDYVSSGTYDGYLADNETEPGSAELVFTLASGSSDSFIAQAAFQSSADTTSNSPTPIPSSLLMLASGLFILFGFKNSHLVI
jgi:hypothetical protein